MAYTPPNGASIELSFGGSYAPQSGASVLLQFGAASLDQYVQNIGADSAEFGTATLYSYRSGVMTGFVDTKFGTQWVSLYVRTVRPSTVGLSEHVGTAWISASPRYLLPSGISAPFIASPTVTQPILYPYGIDSTAFGTAALINQNRFVEPAGFDALVSDAAFVSRSPRVLSPEPIPAQQDHTLSTVAEPLVYNLTSYVFTVTSDSATSIGSDAWVLNRDRYIVPSWWEAPAFGPTTDVRLGGVALHPEGIAPPALSEYSITVEYLHRPVAVDGIVPPAMHAVSVVYNNAVPLYPTGELTEQIGTASLTAINQFVTVNGAERDTSYGDAFVAYAIRNVVPTTYAFMTEHGLHSVYNQTAKVFPDGIDSYHTSATLVFEFINAARPRGIDSFVSGVASVVNRNRSLECYGFNAFQSGDNFVRTQWREVLATGTSMTLWGNSVVKDRRQLVEPNSLDAASLGALIATRIGNDPPTLQTVFAAGATSSRVGTPSARTNVAHTEGADSMRIGQHTVAKLGAHASTEFFDEAFGTAIVELLNRTVIQTHHAPDYSIGETFGLPRMSPFRVYAPVGYDAPDGYTPSGPAGNKIIDWIIEAPIVGQVPQPRVALKHIVVTATGVQPADDFGYPFVDLKLRYVYAKERDMLRWGFPTVTTPFTQYIEPVQIAPTVVVSRATVAREVIPFLQTVVAAGTSANVYGTTRVELLNRECAVTGLFDERLGQSGYELIGDKPWRIGGAYSYEHLRVHGPEPMLPEPFDAARYGDSMVAYRIRTLYVEGVDAFVCESDPEHLDEQLRVARVVYPIPAQHVTAGGIYEDAFAVSDVRNQRYIIRPDGNSETFRQGATTWN